jgi:hypothetical protein
MGRFTAWLARLFNAVPAEEMAVAQLEGPYWKMAYKGVDHADFFRRLAALVPEGSVLVIEGGSRSAALQAFLAEHGVPPTTTVARGTAWPRSDVIHLPASKQVLNALADHAEDSAYAEICTHLHVHASDRILLQWYDAFSAPCYVSKRLPEERLRTFCAELRTSFEEGLEA